MSAEDSDGVAATDNFAIGISFGNSNSSIAYTTGVSSLPFHTYSLGNVLIYNRKAKQKS